MFCVPGTNRFVLASREQRAEGRLSKAEDFAVIRLKRFGPRASILPGAALSWAVGFVAVVAATGGFSGTSRTSIGSDPSSFTATSCPNV